MKTHPLKNDKWRVHFNLEEYKQMLIGAPDRKTRLAMRVMAHSLRVKTLTHDFDPSNIEKIETVHGTIYMLHIEAKDATDRDSATRPRDVWLSEDLIEELEDYLGLDDIENASSGLMFDVSRNTIRNWVDEAAENAAQATGDDDFLKVTTHDFRRYFASHLLYRHDVDPEIVRQLGGWSSPRSMYAYLMLPDDCLAEELGSVGLLGAAADLRPASPVPYRKKNALETLMQKTEDKDRDELKELAREVKEIFTDVDGVEIAVASSEPTAERAAETEADSRQTSFQQLRNLNDLSEDKTGTVGVAATAKTAYVCALIAASWTLTLGPLF